MVNRRRRLVLAASALAAAPRAVSQQPTRSYRVGVICSFSPLTGQNYLAALRDRLAERGFVDGRNLTIEPKFSSSSRDHAQRSAQELIANKADALFVVTTTLTLGVQAATKTVPIVFAWVEDPVASGFVRDYANPGGNATGVTNRNSELFVKRLELLHELVPTANRVAVLAWAFHTNLENALRLAQPAAKRLGMELVRQPAPYGWASAVQSATQSGAQAMLVENALSLYWVQNHTQLLVDEALKRRFPVLHMDHEAVDLGGLVSYATNPIEELRRGADYLARVLNGASAATLPVDQAADFELALNLNTARAMGLNVPPAVLNRANRLVG